MKIISMELIESRGNIFQTRSTHVSDSLDYDWNCDRRLTVSISEINWVATYSPWTWIRWDWWVSENDWKWFLCSQAIFIFPREQVEDLEARCGFLSDIGGKSAFYLELRRRGVFIPFHYYLICQFFRAMDKDWKYLSVGVSVGSQLSDWRLKHVNLGVELVIPADTAVWAPASYSRGEHSCQ